MLAVGGSILELGHDLQPYQTAASIHCTRVSPEHCPMAQRGSRFQVYNYKQVTIRDVNELSCMPRADRH
jgi:hypothetical protein